MAIRRIQLIDEKSFIWKVYLINDEGEIGRSYAAVGRVTFLESFVQVIFQEGFSIWKKTENVN